MRTLLASNDVIRLSFARSLLADAGIPAVVLDEHTSALEGGIAAFVRRLAVAAEDEGAARRILSEAGLTG
jgi:ABC-type transport system involved in cytochrome bd biosynthesis fused ATPase/permease subunit